MIYIVFIAQKRRFCLTIYNFLTPLPAKAYSYLTAVAADYLCGSVSVFR